MTQGHPINFYKVNSVFPQFSPLLLIVKGRDTGNKNTLCFILTRASDLFRVIENTFDIAMTKMRMAHSYYISLRVAQGITKVRMTRISDDRCLFTFDPKASVP